MFVFHSRVKEYSRREHGTRVSTRSYIEGKVLCRVKIRYLYGMLMGKGLILGENKELFEAVRAYISGKGVWTNILASRAASSSLIDVLGGFGGER